MIFRNIEENISKLLNAVYANNYNNQVLKNLRHDINCHILLHNECELELFSLKSNLDK